MAAPYVAGAAALYKSQFPNASPAQTMATMLVLHQVPLGLGLIPSVIEVSLYFTARYYVIKGSFATPYFTP